MRTVNPVNIKRRKVSKDKIFVRVKAGSKLNDGEGLAFGRRGTMGRLRDLNC